MCTYILTYLHVHNVSELTTKNQQLYILRFFGAMVSRLTIEQLNPFLIPILSPLVPLLKIILPKKKFVFDFDFDFFDFFDFIL